MAVCDGINDKFQKEVFKMRSLRGTINDKVSTILNKLNIIDNADFTDINNIKTEIFNTKQEALDELNTISQTIGSITGSCLDGVFNEVGNVINDTGNYLYDLLPTSNPVLDLLGELSIFGDMVNGLGIPGLINNLDELLGCLSTSDCLPVSQLEELYNEIDLFLTDNYLSDDGEYDFDTFLSGSGVSNTIKNGLNNFKTDMKSLESDVKSLANTVSNSVKTAKQPKVSVTNTLF